MSCFSPAAALYSGISSCWVSSPLSACGEIRTPKFESEIDRLADHHPDPDLCAREFSTPPVRKLADSAVHFRLDRLGVSRAAGLASIAPGALVSNGPRYSARGLRSWTWPRLIVFSRLTYILL